MSTRTEPGVPRQPIRQDFSVFRREAVFCSGRCRSRHARCTTEPCQGGRASGGHVGGVLGLAGPDHRRDQLSTSTGSAWTDTAVR